MTVLELSRWQFGITTVYHFIFVSLTIGLSLVVACLQTAWVIKKDPAYLRMTKFFGKIFLINFAVGVVTGIVQEFQFGMNWSAHSEFVGNVFGARHDLADHPRPGRPGPGGRDRGPGPRARGRTRHPRSAHPLRWRQSAALPGKLGAGGMTRTPYAPTRAGTEGPGGYGPSVPARAR